MELLGYDEYWNEMYESVPVGHPPSEDCVDTHYIEVTCVCISGCDDTGDGGGGVDIRPGDGGGGDDGGGSGGGPACDCVIETVCAMLKEYEIMNVDFTPSCNDFRDRGSTENFTWDEFMGGWGNGNEGGIHRPYGNMDQGVMNGAQTLRDMHGGPITLTSDYWCPYGNTAAGSQYPRTSRHMSGTALDIHTGGNRAYFDRFSDFADGLGFIPLPWETYPNRHLHIHR